jgi:hypothetical protein
MDDIVGSIEDQIRSDRRALNRNIQELEDRAQEAMDWRYQYREHSGALLAVAFGSGVILGALSQGRGRSTIREVATRAIGEPSSRAGTHVSQLVADVMDAFVGVAGSAAVDMIADAVPGFRDHFETGRRRPI